MTMLDDFLADPASRFATVAMADTNGLLRGQMVSTSSLKGIAKNGMGMAPAQLTTRCASTPPAPGGSPGRSRATIFWSCRTSPALQPSFVRARS